MRIKREYFDAMPCDNTIGAHRLDDETHSIILEYMEKSWHRITLVDESQTVILWFANVMLAIVSGFYLLIRLLFKLGWLKENSYVVRWITSLNPKAEPFLFWIMVCLFVCVLLDLAYTHYYARYRFLQSVRNREYNCGFVPVKDAIPNVILNVLESNCTEEFVNFRVYPDRQYTISYGFHPYAIVVAQIVKNEKDGK